MKRERFWLQHGWRILFGCAAVIVSMGWAIDSIRQSYARPPMLDFNDAPYRVFTGNMSNGQQDTLMTVSSGQSLILTGGTSSTTNCHIYEDTTMKLDGGSYALVQNGLFSNGQGHLPISAGSTLYMRASGGSCTYYIEGYLVEL